METPPRNHPGKGSRVVSLPMRDGNEFKDRVFKIVSIVVSLPMRDGNSPSSISISVDKALLAYL